MESQEKFRCIGICLYQWLCCYPFARPLAPPISLRASSVLEPKTSPAQTCFGLRFRFGLVASGSVGLFCLVSELVCFVWLLSVAFFPFGWFLWRPASLKEPRPSSALRRSRSPATVTSEPGAGGTCCEEALKEEAFGWLWLWFWWLWVWFWWVWAWFWWVWWVFWVWWVWFCWLMCCLLELGRFKSPCSLVEKAPQQNQNPTSFHEATHLQRQAGKKKKQRLQQKTCWKQPKVTKQYTRIIRWWKVVKIQQRSTWLSISSFLKPLSSVCLAGEGPSEIQCESRGGREEGCFLLEFNLHPMSKRLPHTVLSAPFCCVDSYLPWAYFFLSLNDYIHYYFKKKKRTMTICKRYQPRLKGSSCWFKKKKIINKTSSSHQTSTSKLVCYPVSWFITPLFPEVFRLQVALLQDGKIGCPSWWQELPRRPGAQQKDTMTPFLSQNLLIARLKRKTKH